ncbi:unnamed protein product [Caenorhabditis brenneri]
MHKQPTVHVDVHCLQTRFDTRNCGLLKNCERCRMRAENIFLPRNGYFGVSAATGGLADDHDILDFSVFSLFNEHQKPVPVAEQIPQQEKQKSNIRIILSQRDELFLSGLSVVMLSHPESNFRKLPSEPCSKIGRQGRVGADGLGIWYTSQLGTLGPVFGANDFWTGIGLFMDSFDNDVHEQERAKFKEQHPDKVKEDDEYDPNKYYEDATAREI